VHWLFSFEKRTLRGSFKSPANESRRAEPVGTHAIKRTLTAVLVFLFGAGVGGCSVSKWTVKPHQRELLADRIMQLDADGQERSAEEHILSNREGAVGGTGTSGGGCGCN
jgi:hypothetical protein